MFTIPHSYNHISNDGSGTNHSQGSESASQLINVSDLDKVVPVSYWDFMLNKTALMAILESMTVSYMIDF